ncbi:MAG TPA: LysM peptidoglycan-binding domain-containing M23 family metallopeptidase [Anaerolineaceae bacterium]|nr:LysM peptidoglycan-binding domain-containing M23 family metallopeptidase [Anaerolineaceae bacterium]
MQAQSDNDNPSSDPGSNGKNSPTQETLFRVAAILAGVALLLAVGWAVSHFILSQNLSSGPQAQAAAQQQPTPPVEDSLAALPDFAFRGGDFLLSGIGIPRRTDLHTIMPSRARLEIIEYTVVKGDTVFGIAEKYGLKPETIMWGNFYTLNGVPDMITPGMKLKILPENGTLHKWSKGEGLNGVARFYGVKPETIINYPGNNLTFESVGDLAHPNIPEGTYLFVPGGTRPNDSPATPVISRNSPQTAKYLGAGFCANAVVGAVGTGSFVFPTTDHSISGYSFSAVHPGVDFGGALGNPIFAADSGVVVYAGWTNLGYGNLIVLDHGNGWVTYYGHLSSILVGCGQGVFQGAQIATLGSTGNSTGPHLHFEMRSAQYGKVNPMDFLR